MEQFKNFLRYFWQGDTRALVIFCAGTSLFGAVVMPWSDLRYWVYLCAGLTVIIIIYNVVQFFKYKNFNRKW